MGLLINLKLKSFKGDTSMKTTLSRIKNFNPCMDGWKLLNKNHKKEEISLMEILESNGIENAIWALRCFDYKDYCLFLADVAESVLHIFEKENPGDTIVRECIQGIRDYKAGNITKGELKAHADAAYNSAYYSSSSAASAASDAASAYYYSSSCSAYYYSSSSAAAAADAAAAYYYYSSCSSYSYSYSADAASAYYYSSAKKEKWIEIEKLFVKHFA